MGEVEAYNVYTNPLVAGSHSPLKDRLDLFCDHRSVSWHLRECTVVKILELACLLVVLGREQGVCTRSMPRMCWLICSQFDIVCSTPVGSKRSLQS